jgi:hypothetical protein
MTAAMIGVTQTSEMMRYAQSGSRPTGMSVASPTHSGREQNRGNASWSHRGLPLAVTVPCSTRSFCLTVRLHRSGASR